MRKWPPSDLILGMLVIAFALAGTAFAEQALVIRLKDGRTVRYPMSQVEEVTFEQAAKPTAPARPDAGHPDLVAYWSFDGNGRDRSGNGLHATVHGARFVPGVSGRALQFDGQDDYVIIQPREPFILDKTDFSIEFHVKTSWSGVNDNNTSLINFGGPIYNQFGVRLLDLGYLRGIVAAGKSEYVTSREKLNDGSWHHMLLVRDNDRNELRLYVDGKLARKQEGAAGGFIHRSHRSHLTIGRLQRNVGTTRQKSYFQGAIDEVRIYRRVIEPLKSRPAQPLPAEGLFEFNDLAGWTNRTGGDFVIQEGRLRWMVDRSKVQSLYRRIEPLSGDFTLEFDFQMTHKQNNVWLDVGLAQKLEGGNPPRGNRPFGVFASFGWTGGGAPHDVYYLRPTATYTDELTYTNRFNPRDPETHLRFRPRRWYHAGLQVRGKEWSMTLAERGGEKVGTLQGEFPAAPWEFRYLYVGNPNRRDWPKGTGLLDNLRLTRHAD